MSIVHGDCLEVMAAMEPESVDAIVTDPPYGLEFMGKEWDRLWTEQGGKTWKWGNHGGLKAPAYKAGIAAQEWHARWAEAAFRVAKPSAYLLAFGGTRTVHRMTVALEDAGWIIRDMLVWAYASGFPKSKASLKPAWEPIVMARKPGPLRMLAIDSCRIPMSADDASNIDSKHAGMDVMTYERPVGTSLQLSTHPMPLKAAAAHAAGRWPANVILTDPIFDGGVEGVVGGGETTSGAWNGQLTGRGSDRWASGKEDVPFFYAGDSGTYSRFFLIPKADRADREPLLGGLLVEPESRYGLNAGGSLPQQTPHKHSPRANHHPTVKPTELMRHLVRLVTPVGGTVLDPFGGSGTTALAAEQEGFPWILIEREAEYCQIAEARLNGTQRGLGLSA